MTGSHNEQNGSAWGEGTVPVWWRDDLERSYIHAIFSDLATVRTHLRLQRRRLADPYTDHGRLRATNERAIAHLEHLEQMLQQYVCAAPPTGNADGHTGNSIAPLTFAGGDARDAVAPAVSEEE